MVFVTLKLAALAKIPTPRCLTLARFFAIQHPLGAVGTVSVPQRGA